jgi:hypothetical protein
MASPRQDSTGGKYKLGPISKRGDQYPRRISLVGAHATSKSNAGRSKLHERRDRRAEIIAGCVAGAFSSIFRSICVFCFRTWPGW